MSRSVLISGAGSGIGPRRRGGAQRGGRLAGDCRCAGVGPRSQKAGAAAGWRGVAAAAVGSGAGQIEDALLTPVRDAQGNPLPRVPVDTIIYYNGATVVNGVKSYTYAGVTQGTAYFIFPQQRFKELVHHDLRIDIGPPDISRLIEGQQVGRTRRGVYSDPAQSVEKLTLP